MAKKTTLADARKSLAAVGRSGGKVLQSMALMAASSVLGTVESAIGKTSGKPKKRTAAKTSAVKSPARKKRVVRKAKATKRVARKGVAEKSVARKSAARKSVARKSITGKSAARAATAKKRKHSSR